MIRNYILISLRNLLKNKIISTINIAGLAVGMASFILISLFVKYETNWDIHNVNYDRIYRVQQNVDVAKGQQFWSKTPYPTYNSLKDNYPEFEKTTVIRQVWGEMLSYDNNIEFYEEEGYYAYSSMFDIFSYDFISGSPKTALEDPYSIVLTEELSEKFFPNVNPMGKIIKTGKNGDLKVTGIVKDLPFNSHFRPSYLVSFSTLINRFSGSYQDNWKSNPFFTYALLNENASFAEVNKKISNELDKYVLDNNRKLYLKPLADIHLLPDDRNDMLIILYLFSILAIFILILASVNSVNITTAHGAIRAKEIGIRKVIGSNRSSLIRQFLSESVILSIIAFFISLLFVSLFLPVFNSFVDTNLSFNINSNWFLFVQLFLFFVILGIIAGFYPALYLSSFNPTNLLKGGSPQFGSNYKRKGIFRKILVGFQFTISLILVISTLYIFKQTSLIKNKNLGFEEENLLVCTVPYVNQKNDFDVLRNKLLQNSNVINASISNNMPFYGGDGRFITEKGSIDDRKILSRYNRVDEEFIETYGVKLLHGRNFSKAFSTENEVCIINNTLLKIMSWDDPLEKQITINEKNYRVIGVTEDFHISSALEKISPLIMLYHKGSFSKRAQFTIRISPNEVASTLEYVKTVLNEIYPETLSRVIFFDENLQESHQTLEGITKAFGFFSFLAIVIAFVGLFGLVSYAVDRRIKEISIRKVLGSSPFGILNLISKELYLLLILTNILAFPVAYMFSTALPIAYKYQLGIWDFLLPAIASIAVTIITILFKVNRVVSSNPADLIKYE